MALWGAGLGAAAAATLTAVWPTGTTSALFQVIVLALPVGYALHYVERAWLVRVGSETLGFAQMASAVLAGLAIGLIVGRWWALPALGPLGVITAGSLMMLAFGGLMQIYEEDRPVRTKHQRLALIFGSLAVAIVILPLDTQGWVRWERQYRPSRLGLVDYNRLVEENYKDAKTICLIGVYPIRAQSQLNKKQIKVNVFPLVWGYEVSEPAGHISDCVEVCRTSVFRKFRLERQVYNLVYQRNDGSARLGRFAEYSREWFNQMAEHVSPAGLVIVDIPLSGMTIDAVATIAVTFQYSFSSPADWKLVELEDGNYLRLKIITKTKPAAKTRTGGDWLPVDLMLKDGRDYRPNSIIRDRLTRLMNNNDGKDKSSPGTIDWLRQIHNSATHADSF